MMPPNRLISQRLYGKMRAQRVRREKPPKHRHIKLKAGSEDAEDYASSLDDFMLVDALISRKFF
jgi:hypothetical protein